MRMVLLFSPKSGVYEKKSSLLCIKKPGTETRYIYKGGGWEELQEKIPIHYEILISVRVPINFFHDLTQATHPSPKKKFSSNTCSKLYCFELPDGMISGV